MNYEELLKRGPYELGAEEKKKIYADMLSELTDSENWRHLYTRLHSLACSRKAWQMSALLSLLLPACILITKMSTAT